jgi:hypothetical protein
MARLTLHEVFLRAFRFVPLVTLPLFALFTACRAGESHDDSANGALDSIFRGAQQGAAEESPDVRFLRALADHREGFMQFALATMNHTSRELTRSDAQKLHMRQLMERDSVLLALAALNTPYDPVVAPHYKAAADSVTSRSDDARDAAFYRASTRLHQDGLRLIETHLAHLEDARVRALAQRSKREHETALLRLSTRRR